MLKKNYPGKWIKNSIALTVIVGAFAFTPEPASADINDLLSIFQPKSNKNIGAEQHPKILAQYGGEYIKQGLNDYVLDIGLRLAAVSKKRNLPWRFTILNSPAVNAFALPGGYSYVTRGLLALANNEAELAGVMAHEIGHVNADHSAGRQSRSTGIGIFGAIASVLTDSKVIGDLTNLLGGAYVASYSRDQEYESDKLAVRYLTHAGYPPRAMADFLRRMEAHTKFVEKQAGQTGGGGGSMDFFASHPQTRDRIAKAEELARKASSAEGRSYGQETYLANIKGMIYGDDPEQGVIRGQEFLHPALRFKFSAPDDFQLINTSTAVYAVNKQLGQMTFDLDMDGLQGMKPYQYLRDRWLKKIDLKSLYKTDVNGSPAAIGRATIINKNKKTYLTAVVIDFGAGRIVRFAFVSLKDRQHVRERFQASFRSFQPMGYYEAQELRPYLLRIKTARKKDTLNKWIRRMQGIDAAEDQFALLNALQPGQIPITGSRVKILTIPKE